MKVVKLCTHHQYLLFNTLFSKSKTIPKKSQLSRGLISKKKNAQSFKTYSKSFISEVSVIGKVIFKFMTTLISSKIVSKYLLGFAAAESLSRVRLFVTPQTVAWEAPLSMGILQARILEWVAMISSRGSSRPRNRTRVSCIAGRFFTN